MNKTCDFICSALCGGGIGYFSGYIWFLLSGDVNTPNAILMLTGLVLFGMGTVTALVASVVWTVRHVRIVII